NFLLPILLLTGTIASLFYSFYFLDTKINFPKFHKILIIMISYSSILFILSFILDYSNIIKITAANGIISFVFQLILGIYALLHGIRSAKFFVVGWSFVCLGFIIFALKNFGVMPVNLFTEYSSQIGTALEVVFLSLALADRINKMKEEKVNLQKQALENQKELTKSFARFVPPQLLTFLGKDIITNVGLGDAIKKEMTILFSDIRSFTSISESMTPDENFGFINSYMATMGPCIRKHNGFIDKYIGDAIMALFPENPSDAIDASIDMLEELHNLNQRRKKKGFIPISIGIGIHTGSQMLGIIGEKERLEGTVISDVVNTASRLEGLTKAYSSSLIVSGDVLQNLDSSKYQYRLLDNIKVKGKDRAVRIYEILNGNSKRIIELKLKTKPDFEKAIELYTKGKFKEALKIFKSILKTDSKDKAFLLYIDRCNFYSKNGVSPEWDGIEKLDFK
ncbi:MAG: adenylate/guanylate cyclase domain-containing protein, partial [Leptospiraceae bacterium]|nr:adenylate/guanylate cyclase domain-containing protein [Leptospiraceae bacterium]